MELTTGVKRPLDVYFEQQQILQAAKPRALDLVSGSLVRGSPRSQRSMARALISLMGGVIYIMGDEIKPLISSAAESLPEDVRFSDVRFPSPAGFVWLGDSLWPSGHGLDGVVSLGYECMGWSISRNEVVIAKFGHPQESLPVTEVHSLDQPLSETHRDLSFDTPSLNASEIVFAFLAFLQEPLADNQPAAMKRHEARQLARSKPVSEPIIRVVKLRQPERHVEQHPYGSNRQYNCRWLVRSHIRRQWYPRQERHRSKFIAAYVKGPADAPLKRPQTPVFVVDR